VIWLYVGDHYTAIRHVLGAGRVGEVYNIGGWNEMPNIEIVNIVCRLLDDLHPDPAGPYNRLISYVKDRPGHDRRYAIDARKIERELARGFIRSHKLFLNSLCRCKTSQWFITL
jgi:dTDP-glucose 4,6-dehydratase